MSIVLNLRAESRSMISKKIFLTALVFLSFLPVLFAQSIMDFQDTKVDDLSDQQIQELLNAARQRGYTEEQLFFLAQRQGYSVTELQKLQVRIDKIRGAANNAPATAEPKAAPVATDTMLVADETPVSVGPAVRPLEFFGYDYFKRDKNPFAFESNLVLPPPEGYVLGPKDQLTINIFGASETGYAETIKANGSLLLKNIGPIYVSGMTLAQAKRVITTRIGELYPGVRGANPSTFVDVALSKVRSIQIGLVGEVKRPGNYTINGLSTVYNALYLAGGPTENGTLRNIKILRQDKLIATLDYYSFLLNGLQQQRVRLKNQDVIMVGTYEDRVAMSGEVKRPGIFEVLEGENFEQVLNFAGGFTENAFQERVQIVRNSRNGKVVSEIYQDQFPIFGLEGGDEIKVNAILDRIQNRVVIKGAVNRPGVYALTKDMTLNHLIRKADGLKPDAFASRVLITRSTADLNYESLSVDARDSLGSKGGAVLLRTEDVVTVLSRFDLDAEKFVKVSGEVNNEGVYPFAQGMTASDLIFQAQGFKPAAATGNIEIARVPANPSRDNIAEVITRGVSEHLEITGDEVELNAFDHVIVRKNPDYYPPRTVTIVGEIQFEGEYGLLSEEDRISSILERAGGITELAYIPGATLIRETEFFENNDEAGRQLDLKDLLDNIDYDYLNEADRTFVKEVMEEIATLQQDELAAENLATKAKRERLLEIARRDPFLDDLEISGKESIAIDLGKILSDPESKENLILQDGDVISIPKELTTVRVRGRVLYPNTMRFEESKKLRYFVDKAGGFDTRSKIGKTYVVYANGEVSRTKNFIFYKKFPHVYPGSEIIVPVKPVKIPLKPNEIIGITSGLATLGLLVTQIIQVTR